MNAKQKTFWFYVLLIIGSIATLCSVWYFEKIRRTNAELNMCSDAFCSVNLSVDEKKAFAEEKEQLPMEKEYSEEKVKELIEKALFEKLEKENVLDELEQYGVYLLDKEIYHKKTLENKEILKPHIFYDTYEQMWIVAFGGEWITNDWNVKIFNGDFVGGINFGLKYSDKEGSYLNALERECYSWISDGVSEKKEGLQWEPLVVRLVGMDQFLDIKTIFMACFLESMWERNGLDV